MLYNDKAKELEDKGYLPIGRYEHVQKKDSTQPAFLWHHPGGLPSILVFVNTNELGRSTTVNSVFQQLS